MLIRTIFKNTVFATLGSIFLKVLSFLFSVYIVRQLGDDRFGQYSVVLAFVGLFQIFAELGMTQYAMREIALDRRRTAAYFWNLAIIRMGLAVISMGVITWAATLAGYTPELVLGIFLYTASFLLSAIQAPIQAVLTAYERFDFVTGMSVAGQIAFVLFGAVFLIGGLGYIWLIVASLIGLVAQILVGLWALRRYGMLVGDGRLVPGMWPGLVRSGLPFGMISLALTVAFNIDAVMLKMYYPDQVVGWYRVAYNLVFSILFFINGFKDAIVPSLARTYASDPRQVERWYYRTVKMIVLVSTPIAVGGMLIARPLILFLYTADFLPSVSALQILVWDVPFLMFTAFCGNITTVISEERAAARIYAINAIANVVLNLIFIPRYGIIGASLVTVMTDVIGALQFHFLLRRKLHLPSLSSIVLRALIAAGLMGGVVWLLSGLNFLITIFIGALIYTALALALRMLDDQEWAFIIKVLRHFRLSQPA